MSPVTRGFRLKQLAAGLSAALALGTADIRAQVHTFSSAARPASGANTSHRFANDIVTPSTTSTTPVTNCDDTGSGSLRQVISVAVTREHVDLSALTCSTITLTSGEIPISLGYLNIDGPAGRTLTITSNGASRIFHDTGANDQLTIHNLAISGGKYYSSTGNAKGGCIESYGGVILQDSIVSGCRVLATANGSVALGGAINASNVDLFSSKVTGSSAIAAGTGVNAIGGGITVLGALRASYSTLSGNSAYANATGASAQAGGASVLGSVYLYNSTVDSNQGAGIYQGQLKAGDKVVIQNSTISGNGGQGVSVDSPLKLYNSTVAFNSSGSCAGVYSRASIIVRSSIIAKNTNLFNGTQHELCILGGWTLTGSHNLITSSNVAVPGDTLTSDPRLVPLGNHGGPTRTHALPSNSPAIDAGNNTGAAPTPTDQRGTGFAREVPSGKPDIGAYERQINDDEIFYDGFN